MTSSLLKRLSTGALALALLLAATPALAQTRTGSGSGGVLTPKNGMRWGVLGALDLPPSGFKAGPRIIGEMMYGLGELAPNLALDVGPRVSWSYNGADNGSLWTLDAIGVGRLTYQLAPQLGLYGEAGLGLGYYHVSIDALPGFSGDSDSGLMLTILFAPGVTYAITPSINLLGEVGFWINAREGSGTHVAIPTIGVQFAL